MIGLKKRLGLLFAVVVCICMILPQNIQAKSYVPVSYNGRITNYEQKKNYVMVNGKKINVPKMPIFMKEGCYMGPASKIFKKSSLKVTYKKSGNRLSLTYKSNVLTMTSGTRIALLNGKVTTLPAAPIYATYKKNNLKRWMIPLYGVCSRLGISYVTSDGVARMSGTTNSLPPKTTTTAKPATTTAAKPTTTTAATTASKPSTKRQFKIVIDAGHGGIDSGAMGNDLKEKNMNLAIVLGAKKYFDNDSRFKVYYTRTSDSYPSLTDRSSLANKVDADLFLCVHINSASASANGTETLYNGSRLTTTKKNGITSKDFALAMQQIAVSSTGFRNRGLVNRTNLSVLNKTAMPACLIEYGFISNTKEARTINASTSRYGKELYLGVVNYLKKKNLI